MALTRVRSTIPVEIESIAQHTISVLLTVHREFGPGMTEGVYAAATRLELADRHIQFESEKVVPVRYRGHLVCHQRIDLVVEDAVIVEIKSVERIHPVHVAQAVSYLRLTGLRLGFVVNFNVPVLKAGLRRVVL